MKTRLSTQFGCLVLCTAFSLAVAEAAADSITISDSPLQTAIGLPPNILFVIDDSGSMRWGFTPDTLVTRLPSEPDAGHLLTRECDETGDYAGAENTCHYQATGLRYLVSAWLNKSYYDPKVGYSPPFNADGSQRGAASFDAAPLDGFDPASEKINLATNYRAVMDDFYYWAKKSEDWYSGFTISPGANAGHAFYYSYDGACSKDEYDDSCYTYRKVSDDEKENFANWFSFYRTRMLTSKRAIGEAFTTLSGDIRIGYGAINSGVIQQDVMPFNGSSRSSFYHSLYAQAASGGTPLRKALATAGEYYSSEKPWRDDPANANSPIRSCRRSFTMLMTDGYYNDAFSGIGNVDQQHGPEITGPGAQSYQYLASGPFQDNYSDTLADIAMYYWKRDLLPDVDNRVPVKNVKLSPAFWQNMTTFGVSLGIPTQQDPAAAFEAIENNSSISWPDPAASDAAKLDDLLHAAVNSRGGFFNANNATEFNQKLTAALENMSKGTGSAANLGGVSTSSQTGAKIFQGRYQGEDWAGDLWSYDANNGMQIAWKASEGIPVHHQRRIQYFKGNTLSHFTRENVTAAELALTEGEAPGKNNLVDYLRGDQSHELDKINGQYRVRSVLLGDIAHSAPLYIGAAERRTYHRYGWPESASYLSFIAANKARKGVVYVGANDGMLHAFSDDSSLGDGAGHELFAYVPRAVLPRLKQLANPSYQHQYYVDGLLASGDAYINGGWKTLVIGTLGRGGAGSTNSIFALDATDPAAITPLWELPYAELGQNTGKVLIARSAIGKWIGIIGYGYNNATNAGGILLFDLASGAEIKKIALPGTAGLPNGFGQLESWDTTMDGNVDYVYAGDYHGNIWKFDISSSSSSQWGLANNDSPLFTAKVGANTQPITSGLSISREPNTGKIWLVFGTGSYLSVADKASISTQSIYGIVDETSVSLAGTTLTRNNLKPKYYQESGDFRLLQQSSALNASEKGWYIDLTTDGERVVLPPLMIDGVVVINTLKPDDDPCMAGGISWRMAIEPYSGGRLKRNFFHIDHYPSPSGVKTESATVGYTVIRTVSKSGELIYSEVSGPGDASTPPSRPINVTASGRRLTWRELTNE